MWWQKVQDKLIGVAVTCVTALVFFYFGSFATKAQIEQAEAKMDNLEKEVKEYYAKKEDVKELKTELKYIKQGQKDLKEYLVKKLGN